MSLLPSAVQRRLLRAALLDEGRAQREWVDWRGNGGDIDALDYPAQAVLPMIYSRLSTMGLEDPDMARLRGVYRHRWSDNMNTMGLARPVLSLLAAAKIETMICGTAALVLAYTDDRGSHPVEHVDVAVRASDARRALELLMESYVPCEGIEASGALGVRCGIKLSPSGTGNKEVALNWSTLPSPEDTAGVFERARRLDFLGIPVTVSAPTDLVLSSITHGTGYDPHPVRWILECGYLLSSAPEQIDWGLLEERARSHSYAWQLGFALAALEQDYGAPVPAGMSASLLATSGGAIERAMWHLQRKPPRHGVRCLFLFDQWLRARSKPYPGGTPGSLASFVQARVQASSKRDTARKLWRREGPW